MSALRDVQPGSSTKLDTSLLLIIITGYNDGEPAEVCLHVQYQEEPSVSKLFAIQNCSASHAGEK